MASTFFVSEMSEIGNLTIKHVSTYTLVHSSIITYMGDYFLVTGDHLSIITPFCVTRAYGIVNQRTSHLNV